MICNNDTCKSNKKGKCKFPKMQLTLNSSGTCISFEPAAKTCGTCGASTQKGYKLLCKGWGEPFPDEVYAEKAACGNWRRK